jgi:hypothetical protein
MVKLLWARHGENVANLTGTLSYRVFDGDLTERASGKRGSWPGGWPPQVVLTRSACWPARRCAGPGRRHRSSAPSLACQTPWKSMTCGN